MGLDTKQVDYTCAFLHAPITEYVYVHMPRRFEEEGKVLKLQKSLYGLRQSPRNFFEHLKENLFKVGFKQSEVDPCLSSQIRLFVEFMLMTHFSLALMYQTLTGY